MCTLVNYTYVVLFNLYCTVNHRPCCISNIYIYIYIYVYILGAGIAQSVQRLATGWTVRGSNPGGDEIFPTRPDRPCGPPGLLYNGYRVFPGGKVVGRGVNHPPHLAPMLKKE